MLEVKSSFCGLSVKDLAEAKEFYGNVVGLKLDNEEMGLQFDLPGGGGLYIYSKDDHQPATYTALNFVVDDIDAAVGELVGHRVTFEQYEGMTDEKGIARGISRSQGPDIAWFKDPAGNILSVLQQA